MPVHLKKLFTLFRRINVCPSGKPCSLSHSTGVRRRILPSPSNTIGASWLHVKVGAELSVFISAPPCPCAMATMFVSSQDLIAMSEVYLVVSFPRLCSAQYSGARLRTQKVPLRDRGLFEHLRQQTRVGVVVPLRSIGHQGFSKPPFAAVHKYNHTAATLEHGNRFCHPTARTRCFFLIQVDHRFKWHIFSSQSSKETSEGVICR